MPSTNGHDLERAILYVILYARVSTEEQARSGYSLAQQMEALREYAAREGYEVLEEVFDRGQSGASLERPGMDRVRDLVAVGGVSIVLAQDRDRFAREPAYHYLLRREFEEHGTKIRALNDRGDESPEGELTDGILDQLGKYQRAKIMEMTRRGKLRKAREGKVIAGHTPNYGFRYNEARDNYVVHEEEMQVVGRIFDMVSDGTPLYAVKRALEREGVPTPPKPKKRAGVPTWSKKTIRDIVLDDVYRARTYDEVLGLVSPEVAGQLDPKRCYGIWWFNRRRTTHKTVAELGADGQREYRKRQKTVEKPKENWIAVPVPDPGIPHALVDAARLAIKDNRPTSRAGDRFWELSGGVFYCGGCERRMSANRVLQPKTKKPAHYYRCPTRQQHGKEACPDSRHHRADEAEPYVWRLVCAVLTADPEQLRSDLDRMIELERQNHRGDPELEANAWLDKLADVDRERRGYLRLAAKGRMTDEDLDEELSALEETRKTAERELEGCRGKAERIAEMERDRDAILESYAGAAPEALDALTPEERRHVYGMLKVRAVAMPDGRIVVSGAFVGDPLGDPLASPEPEAVCLSVPSRR